MSLDERRPANPPARPRARQISARGTECGTGTREDLAMASKDATSLTSTDRRQFLHAFAAGTLAATAPGMLMRGTAAAAPARPPRFVLREDRFGRMFSDL